jgi:glucans biosynthesis protein C
MVTFHEQTIARPAKVAARTGARFAYIDNLRIYLTLLVVLHHAAIAYGGAGDWAIRDRITDEISPILLSIFNGINQAYFMATFFLLAGYFTPAAFQRKGAPAFLIDRLIRLGIPLLVYTTLILNINGYLIDRFYVGQAYQVRLEYEPGHLWFLQALLVFAVVYVLIRSVTGDKLIASAQKTVRPFPTDRTLWGWIGILAVLTFAVRVRLPVGVWAWGVQPGHFVHYIFAFSAGIVAYHNGWFEALTQAQARRWGIGVLLGIPAFGLVGVLAGVLDDPTAMSRMMGGLHWEALLYALWESFFLIAAMIFLLHLFRTRFNQAGPQLRFLAANVYTVYIIHQTILYAANIGLLNVDLPSIVKFFLAAAITIPVCFLLSALIRRLPGTTRILG